MSEETRTIALPSGRSATLRVAKVRDLLQAHRVAQFSSEPMTLAMALVAQVALLDGKPVLYEDLLELPAADGLLLQAEVIEGEAGPNFHRAPGGEAASS